MATVISYPYTPCNLEQTLQITALHTAFSHKMEPGYSSPGESHDFWEILLVLEGTLSVVSGEFALELPKNTMLIHPPQVFHRHFNAGKGENTYAVLSFSAQKLPVAENATYALSPEQAKEFRQIVRFIRDNYRMDKICVVERKVSAPPSVDQAVKSRLEYFLSTALFSQTSPYRHTNQDYRRIVQFLTDNIHRSMTVPMIAKELGMSTANLKRVFSLYAGIGVMKYFHALKFRRATALLEEGWSVRDISDALGFSSQSAFSTAFKNALGMPPSTYGKPKI